MGNPALDGLARKIGALQPSRCRAASGGRSERETRPQVIDCASAGRIEAHERSVRPRARAGRGRGIRQRDRPCGNEQKRQQNPYSYHLWFSFLGVIKRSIVPFYFQDRRAPLLTTSFINWDGGTDRSGHSETREFEHRIERADATCSWRIANLPWKSDISTSGRIPLMRDAVVL